MTAPLSILQVHNRYRQAGGEDTVVDAERSLLAGAGHHVDRFEAENPTSAVSSLGNLLLSPWNPVSSRALTRHLADRRPDVAHIHNTWYSLSSSVIPALHRAGVPTVMTVHNYRLTCLSGQLYRDGSVCTDCVGRYPLAGVRHACYRGSHAASLAVAAASSLGKARQYWQRHVDRFVVMTGFARDLLADIGVDPANVWVKPHFAPDPGSRPAPPSASDTVLFVGRLGHEKGLQPFLAAWRVAAPDLKLRVIGDGDLRPELAADLPAGVELVGWLPVDRVKAEMLSARALVFPSVWYETFGMVLIEAMAAGLPVLASGIAGVPETVGGGLPHPAPGDHDSWVAGIEALEAGDADAIGASNRRTFLSRYSVEEGLRGLEDLYRTVIAEHVGR